MAVLLLLPGCSHYSTDPQTALPFETLYVAPISNQSFAPQAQALLADQLIQALQMESEAIQIVSRDAAQATLKVVIEDYDKEVAATQSNDTFLARSYNVIMIASVSLIDNRTGDTLMRNRRVRASLNTFVTPDGFVGVEYQTMPILTRKLAEKIKDRVISVW